MAPVPSARINVHATGVVIAGIGVLFRGAPGSGKSLLALELLERAAALGEPAALVGDDRLDVARRPSGLVMSAPPNLAGRIELRGRGIIERPSAAAARIDLVVDLVDDLVRLPEPHAFETDILGLILPCCPVPRRGVADPGHQMLLVREAMRPLLASGRAKAENLT